MDIILNKKDFIYTFYINLSKIVILMSFLAKWSNLFTIFAVCNGL